MANIARLLFIFLLAASAFAQSHKHWLIAPRSSAKTYSLPHTNQIKWWWVATNLSDPVANWMAVDGFTDLYQGTGANQPRWTNGQGVHFDGTAAFLSSTNVSVGADYAKLLIVRPTVVNPPATYAMIATTTGDGNEVYLSANQWGNGGAGLYGTAVTNIIYDHFTWAQYNGFPIAAASVFTNGIVAKTGAGWGPTLNELGRRYNNTAYYSGAIYEFIVWVNATNITLEDITNMHAYCTNKYGFWP